MLVAFPSHLLLKLQKPVSVVLMGVLHTPIRRTKAGSAGVQEEGSCRSSLATSLAMMYEGPHTLLRPPPQCWEKQQAQA